MPFPTHRLASTALQALQVDKELSPLVRRSFALEEDEADSESGEAAGRLRIEYRATTNRMLRVSVNAFMDSLKLIVEVMEQLDVDVLEGQIPRENGAASN